MGDKMCDIKKYKAVYQDIKELEADDTLELILSADSKEEQDFFELVGDFLLQNKQRKVIKDNKF